MQVKHQRPEDAKAWISNVETPGQPFQVMLSDKGEMIIQTKVGELIYLTPKQTIELFTFFDGPRVKARMFDTIRSRFLRKGGVHRRIIQAIDAHFDGVAQ